MKAFLKRLKRPFKQLLGRIPMTLPIGVTTFETFCVDIFETYNIPNNESYRNAIAVMILQGAVQNAKSQHKVAKFAFYKELKAAQAREIANHMMREYHHRLDERREAEKNIKDVTPETDESCDKTVSN